MDSIQRPITISMSTCSAYDLDLRDVRGQIGARRALEIAAAGGHNVLMIGPPGCGKTMLAVRVPALLPVADGDTECPFRAPHHTASAMAMLGGAGEVLQPGEVSRADGGVLFLDELPEFSRAVLGGLREALEHGAVTLRRRLGHLARPVPARCGDGAMPVRGMRRDASGSTVHRRADGALPRSGGADHRRPGTVGAGRSRARRRSGGVPTRRPRCVVRRAPMMVESLRHRDGEAAAGARTPEPKRGDDTRYHYYVSRGRSSSFAVFVCDHAYDCEPLCREACEQEVIALIGTDALRAAQDECAWNGLGSKRLLVYVGATRRRTGALNCPQPVRSRSCGSVAYSCDAGRPGASMSCSTRAAVAGERSRSSRS